MNPKCDLKTLYKEFFQGKTSRRQINLMICNFKMLSKDAVHLPMLITDGKYHAGAYFTKQSITLFKKRHSGGTLLSLFGSFIKISKWHFELVDVPIGDDDKVSEVYTSYQGKELRLIIEEFDKTKRDKKFYQYENETTFTDNLHWNPDIKLEIARLRHMDLKHSATSILPFENVVVVDMKKHFKGSQIVDVEKIIHEEITKQKQVKTVKIWSATKLISCFSKMYGDNIKAGELPLVLKITKNIDRIQRRKSRYFSRESIAIDSAETSIKKRTIMNFQFKIKSTRSSQSFNFEGKEEGTNF